MYFIARRVFYVLSIATLVSTGHCLADDQSLVQAILASAIGKIPGLSLSNISSFSFAPASPAVIAGRSYQSAITTSAKLEIPGLKVSTNIKLNVNPNPSDFALKINAELPRITIWESKFYIKACCNGSGGPILDLEIAQKDIQATEFQIDGAVSFPPCNIDADVKLTYKDGLLSAQLEKHNEIFDAALTVKISLPNPLKGNTGLFFTLSGGFEKLIKEKLTSLLDQWKADTGQCTIQEPESATDVKGWLQAGKGFVENPEACAKAALGKLIQIGPDLIKLKDARGSWTINAMKSGESPTLDLVRVEVNVPKVFSRTVELSGITFDFKNPQGSATSIAKKLVRQITGTN